MSEAVFTGRVRRQGKSTLVTSIPNEVVELLNLKAGELFKVTVEKVKNAVTSILSRKYINFTL